MERQAAELRVLDPSAGSSPPKPTADSYQRKQLVKESGMRLRFQSRTFERFTVTPENEHAYRAAMWYADHFGQMIPMWRDGTYGPEKKRNGLFFTGDCGVGKTHLAASIANRVLDQGRGVVCMTMIDLLARLKETFGAAGCAGYYGPTEAGLMQRYEEVPLLIIDDLGSEQPTEWGISKIYAIINARYEAYMPIIITTNYTGDELAERMTPGGRASDQRNAQKTIDRLREVCGAVEMRGESWRGK